MAYILDDQDTKESPKNKSWSHRSFELKTISCCAANVPQNALDECPVHITWIMHVKVGLLHGYKDQGASASDTEARRCCCCRMLDHGVVHQSCWKPWTWCPPKLAWACNRHAGTFQDVIRLLSLRQEEDTGIAPNLNAEKEVQWTQVFPGELIVHWLMIRCRSIVDEADNMMSSTYRSI